MRRFKGTVEKLCSVEQVGARTGAGGRRTAPLSSAWSRVGSLFHQPPPCQRGSHALQGKWRQGCSRTVPCG